MLEENNDNWNVAKMEYPYGNGINISMSVENVENLYRILCKNQYKIDKKIKEFGKIGGKNLKFII